MICLHLFHNAKNYENIHSFIACFTKSGRHFHHFLTLEAPFLYTLLTLEYEVNLLNAPISSALRRNLRATLTGDMAAACKRVFPLRHSETRSTSANYLLLRYKVPILVVMECKRASVIHVHTS